ncbi:J domain-containing protein [Xenorhabdus ishibashii]|uniref:Molecular chaperone DnaJ n=1 Tax=Xenorhabdus ishibashii TaxID=1034471 RepID=A0A2D0K8I0_9GAMM|nr:J domain-containing protein [Xenorhabdus ishibashii]PHM59517.1 molecular chaperone DnaJ [Xenorhabdus ishibashii]
MNFQEALNVFGLSGELTEIDVKQAYKKSALKYHPDRNSIGAEMMKAVNHAYNFLMKNIDRINEWQSTDPSSQYNYGEKLESVLTALITMEGVFFEVTGNWIWISGNTKPHKEELKNIGCKWARKKKLWNYHPEEHKCLGNRREHSMDEIREKYGTSGLQKSKGRLQVENRA